MAGTPQPTLLSSAQSSPTHPTVLTLRTRFEWPTVLLFALLLLGLGGGIGYGLAILIGPGPIRSETPVRSPGVGPAGTYALAHDLELRYQIVKGQLDSVADNAKQISTLIALLLSLSSLYALALGLNSFFGLKQILDAGKDDLGRLKDFLAQSRTDVRDKLQEADTKVGGIIKDANSKLSEFRTELREKYPELANLDANLREVLLGITLMFRQGRNWTVQYAALTFEQRERFRVAEMRMAGLEVFRPGELNSLRDEAARVYQGLGRFYSSKYQEEKQRGDWERASLYFGSARQLASAKPPAELMKDLGVHLTLIEQAIDNRGGTPTADEATELEKLRTQAEQAFRAALGQNPLEPGALFGLGWILYKRKDYAEAILQYVAITTITAWADSDRQKYLEDAYLNQAGCCTLAATMVPDDPAYDEALELLKKSKEVAIEYNRLAGWREKVAKERGTGDLQKLNQTKPNELDQLLA